jgi:hypothetical protein
MARTERPRTPEAEAADTDASKPLSKKPHLEGDHVDDAKPRSAIDGQMSGSDEECEDTTDTDPSISDRTGPSYHVIVKGDTNDGDYCESTTECDTATFDVVQRVAAAVRHRGGQWANQYCNASVHDLYVATGVLTADDIATFEEFVPCSADYEQTGTHRIVSIKVLEVVKTHKLL